jgi:hypothetical protein
MTLTLRQFPEVVGGWVLNGKNAAFSPLASYAWLPVSPYKRVDTSLIPATPVAPAIAPSLWKVETYSPVYHWSI